MYVGRKFKNFYYNSAFHRQVASMFVFNRKAQVRIPLVFKSFYIFMIFLRMHNIGFSYFFLFKNFLYVKCQFKKFVRIEPSPFKMILRHWFLCFPTIWRNRVYAKNFSCNSKIFDNELGFRI